MTPVTGTALVSKQPCRHQQGNPIVATLVVWKHRLKKAVPELQSLDTSSFSCSWCGTQQDPGTRCCDNCGHVVSDKDLSKEKDGHWATSLLPLKLLVTLSAAFTIYLIWLASANL